MKRDALASAALAALAVLSLVGAPDWPTVASAQQRSAGSTDGIDVIHVKGHVHMIVGAGANVAVSAGDDGILVVDTGSAESADRLLAAVRRLSEGPIQFILNTTFGDRHTGGNETIAKAGQRVTGGGIAGRQMAILAHENVLNRMSAPSGSVSPRAVAAWPTDTFFISRKEVFFNDEAVQMFHRPATTDGDTIVFFRRSDVVVAGDMYATTSFPVINLQAGGHINGIIEGLNDILDLTVPANKAEDGTLVIPGSGRLSDEADVALYRDMVTIIRDRVQDAIKRGQTLAQVKADKRITLEYEGQYGAATGPWTTGMFLEAIYQNLTSK